MPLNCRVWLTWKWLLRPLFTTSLQPSIGWGNTSVIWEQQVPHQLAFISSSKYRKQPVFLLEAHWSVVWSTEQLPTAITHLQVHFYCTLAELLQSNPHLPSMVSYIPSWKVWGPGSWKGRGRPLIHTSWTCWGNLKKPCWQHTIHEHFTPPPARCLIDMWWKLQRSCASYSGATIEITSMVRLHIQTNVVSRSSRLMSKKKTITS